jgi:RNA 3'-terminal phosphate cyclase (ATP)
VRITGGTNVSNSPSYEYFDQVLFPVLEKIGIPRIERKMIARGWSQGGAAPQIGCVEYAVTPLARPLPAFQLTDRGRVERVHATVLAPRDAEARFCDMLRNAVSRNKGVIFGDGDADLASTAFSMSFEDSGHARRYYVLLVATTTTGMKLGRDCLYQGPSGLTQEHIIKQAIGTAVRDLATEIRKGGCVDEHLRDQLVVFQGLAEGRSRVFGGREPNVAEERLAEPNLHAKTARWVLTEMLGVVFDEDGSCEGVGHRPGTSTGREEECERVG